MKIKSLFIFVIVLGFLMAQTVCAQLKNNEQIEPSKFGGKIGSFDIYVELNNINNQIIGWYIYPGKSTKLRLEGSILSNGEIELEEYNYRAQYTGHFKGIIDQDNSITGEWTNPEGTKKLGFYLNLSNEIQLFLFSNDSEKNTVTPMDQSLTINKRKMFQPSKVEGFSKLALWITIFLFLGVSILFILYFKLKKKPLPEPKVIIEKEVHHVNGNIEDELSITTKKGQMFEKHIIQKFGVSKEYYELIKDRSDKDYGGIYAKENSYPDLVLRFKNENKGWTEDFAVECKYRSGLEKGSKIFVDKLYKIENYKKYKVEKGMQVFIALGVGGTPDNPDETYVLPIDIITNEFIDRNDIFNFKNKYNYFYFDYLKKTLS